MSVEEVRSIVSQFAGNGVPLHWSTYLLILLISLLASGFGAWLGSYLREKGKHLATREDIGEIVEQLRQTTKATEEIKAQVSSELWVGQRKRELQLETLHETNGFLSQYLVLDCES
ncbi:MAG TPA: hypothetical protein VFF86_09960 [Candidatus Methylomirabilis sp.]|nr:hypothetical protein [Candidatus Methylomirabilis sp.]